MSERELRSLRDALADVGRELGLPDPESFGRVTSHWSELVGATLAEHAEPRSLRDGVLVIRAAAPAWGSQLRYLEDQIVARCCTLFGTGLVTTIRVVVGGAEKGANSPG